MQAAEELDNLTKSMFNISLIESLQPTLHLLICKTGHVTGGALTIVHKSHERGVSALLKLDLILEASFYHQIHFVFKVHEL